MNKRRYSHDNASNNYTPKDHSIYRETSDEPGTSCGHSKSTAELIYASEQKYKQLIGYMNEISSTIASSDISANIKTLFENISMKIADTIGLPLCSIWLMDEDGNINCMASAGELSSRISTVSVKANVSAFGAVSPDINIHDFTNACKKYMDVCKLNALEESISDKLLFIPFFLNSMPKGTLAVCCNDTLDEDYVDLLRSITNNLAFAVEKAELYKKFKQDYLRTIMGLIAAIEAKDTYTQGHSIRVSQYAVEIARELGLSREEVEEVEIAGILHDIGKIGINDAILTKPGLLEPCEFEMVKEHPDIGRRILQPIGLSENIINATLLHHKRYDLKGYPENTAVKELPLIANIICVADAYDAMTSYRSYKSPMARKEAIEELKSCSGTQFSPDIVKTMESLYNKKLL